MVIIMSKLIKNVAFAIIMVTLLMVCTTGVVFADEAETQTNTEPEKELVLYNADGDIDGDGTEDLWVGLRYFDEENNSCLEVSYNGKSLTSFVEKGYKVEVQWYGEDSSDNQSWSDWFDIENMEITSMLNKDLFTFDYFYLNSRNIYQFRIIGSDGNIISMSDRLVINSDTTFPVVISSKPYNYDLVSYAFDKKSIKIMLKFNDNIVLEDINQNAYITISPSKRGFAGVNYLDGSYFATNLNYSNYSEKISIDGIDYDWNYSIVTFNCNFPHCKLDNTNYDSVSIRYKITLNNLTGKHLNSEQPIKLFFFIWHYKDTSLNPQKKLTIKEHVNQLEVNETVNLNVDILSDEISKDNLIWVSSDENIATVDENGIVTATGLGKAYIYATEENTDELYDYSIIDVVMPVSNISLDISTLSLKTGAEHQLIPTVEPEGADKTVTWTSSNENVATVDENGIVTAKKAGSAVITVTSNYDPNISRNCNIIVSDPIQKIESIKLKGLPSRIKVGSRFKLTAITSPSNATNKKVTWKSSNTKYATVTSSGTVSIKSAGAGKTVKITATAKDGSGIKKTVTFNIEKIKVTKIKLKASNTIVAGKSLKITATITPSNATNKKVTWKSSNKKYATVSSTGIVTTKKAGKGKVVKITAISKDNSKIKATIKIKIK